MRTRSTRSTLAVALVLAIAPGVRAKVTFVTALDGAQEIPPTASSGQGQGMLVFDDEAKTITYDITITGLSGTPVAAHIHEGAPGVDNPAPTVSLDVSGQGTADLSSLANLDAFLVKLFNGETYVNVHTAPTYLGGEIRGQIELGPATCPCADTPNHGQFVRCVRHAIKQLEPAERKEEAILALKRAIKKSSCGKKHAPKKAIACCLPRTPEENIVTEALCLPVSDALCVKKNGTSKGAGSSCLPTNPCP